MPERLPAEVEHPSLHGSGLQGTGLWLGEEG